MLERNYDYRGRDDKQFRDAQINSANGMKHEVHGTQPPKPIDQIDEEAGTAQRSDSRVQPINQRSLSQKLLGWNACRTVVMDYYSRTRASFKFLL